MQSTSEQKRCAASWQSAIQSTITRQATVASPRRSKAKQNKDRERQRDRERKIQNAHAPSPAFFFAFLAHFTHPTHAHKSPPSIFRWCVPLQVKEDDKVVMEKLPHKHLKQAGLEHKVECIRLRTTLPVPPAEACRLLNDYEVRKMWEDMLTKESRSDVVLLEREKETMQVIRTLSNQAMGGLISPREFVDLGLTQHREDGSILHIAQSIDHPDFKPTKGFVRGVNFACGMIYAPVRRNSAGDDSNGDKRAEGDESTKGEGAGEGEGEVVGTHVTYVIHSDVGGWLPASLVFKGTTSTMWGILQQLHTLLENGNAPGQ